MARQYDKRADRSATGATDAMTYQAPIFNEGLFGKANGFVVNGWSEASRMTSENAEGILWAQQERLKMQTPDAWLAKVTAATAITTNRYSYTFEPFGVATSSGSVAMAPVALQSATTWGTGSGAINIREFRNTSTIIDGSPIPTGVTFGAVGASFTNSAWTTTNLQGYVHMHIEYLTDGAVLYWFDAPQPLRCSS